MSDQAEPTGMRSILTFAAGDPTQVDALTARAVARLVKLGFDTAFGQ
jgi:hypothetical protein